MDDAIETPLGARLKLYPASIYDDRMNLPGVTDTDALLVIRMSGDDLRYAEVVLSQSNLIMLEAQIKRVKELTHGL